MMLPVLRNRFFTPFAAFEPWNDLRREIDRLFDSVLSGRVSDSTGSLTWIPPMDVHETDNAIELAVEVPGVNPDDLDITVENGVLTVSGEKKLERTEGNADGAARFVERRYGRFQRSVVLPDYADADNITAHYDHGVLTIEIAKVAQAKPRKIEIARGTSEPQLVSGGQSAKGSQGESRKVA